MLQNDCIPNLLDMEHLEVKNVEHSANQIVLYEQMKRRACRCPARHAVTDQVHDYCVQQVKDCPIQGKHVIWRVYPRNCVNSQADEKQSKVHRGI